MPDEPTPEPQPQPQLQPHTLAHEAPDWAVKLQQTLEDLPGKLRATVSDEDRSSIAEGVFNLFERGGAFEQQAQQAQSEQKEVEGEAESDSDTEGEPRKGGGLSSFARRFMGE